MNNLRELALDMLMEISEKGAYSHLIIRTVLDKYDYLEYRDKAFIKRLTEGTLERQIQIDYILNQFSKVPVKKMKPLVRNLLRMSVYQMLFMDSIPDRAVCDEAVKLAGKRGFRGLTGFINGVLRNIGRNKDKIAYPDANKDVAEAFSVQYSLPKWLVEQWLKVYGREKTKVIAEALLAVHPVTLRLREDLSEQQKQQWLQQMNEQQLIEQSQMSGQQLNEQQMNAQQREQQLNEQKVMIVAHPYLPYAYQLSGAERISQLPGYQEGWFTVQDVSSMLVCEAAGLKGDELVVDVCAAPGGKSLHVAEKLQHRTAEKNKGGKVIARDLTEYKVSLIDDNQTRMGYTNIETQIYDASILDENLIQKADVVLADLPCSGLGILGKKRDIKYRITPEVLDELVQLQKKILDVVWNYVKLGGVLVYSTCTIHIGENQDMVKWFTDNYPFELESLTPYLPEQIKEEGSTGMLQLLPGIHETDGFFLARLRREK